VSYSVHATRYRMFHDELSDLLDRVLTGEIIDDRATAERVVRSLGVVVDLHERHRIDENGWCGVCWAVPRRWWRPWPRRSTCTVYSALDFFLRQRTEAVLAAIEDRPKQVHRRTQ
jgi:hypothetical protein